MPTASPMIGELKLCRPCSTWKMKSEFARDSRIKSGLSSRCKSCNRSTAKKHREANPGLHASQVAVWRQLNPSYGREYYEANIERLRKAGIISNRMRQFGISDDQYLSMWESQNGQCAICKNPETARYVDGKVKNLAVDHCHSSKKVRKLLCQRCNTALGSFKDDPELLRAAINYLEEYK